MSVADLTGTTWLFNSILNNLSPAPVTYHLIFTSNNTSYTTIGWTNNGKSGYSVSYGSTQIYTNGVWGNDAYKTITISGGTDATNANLISRIELNATQVITSHDVTISYNNSTIAYLDASGTEILDTDGTYMADDITIEYTKPTPAAGSATTPATTITANPSISVSNSGLITATASATQSVTPTVVEGYVSSGTAGTITVSGSNTSQLTTQAATTYTPTTANQTIASGKYLTGAQTILGDTNLTAENIKKDVSIFNVTGTYEGSGGGGGTPVNFSISGDAAGTQFLYVDDSGTYHKISGASVSGTSVENNLVVVFQIGPEAPGGYTITGLTHKETISLGNRANYKAARIYVVTA